MASGAPGSGETFAGMPTVVMAEMPAEFLAVMPVVKPSVLLDAVSDKSPIAMPAQ
jgi:hypothetical protein